MKKLLVLIFGEQKNLYLKFNISLFLSGFLFALFAVVHAKSIQSTNLNFFEIMTTLSFSLWLIITQGADAFEKTIEGLFRLLFQLIIFSISLNYCYSFYTYRNTGFRYLFGVFACIGLLSFVFYCISIFSDIFVFIKRILILIKNHFFGQVNSTTSKVKIVIENITALLLSITSFIVVFKSIMDTLLQVFNKINNSFP